MEPTTPQEYNDTKGILYLITVAILLLAGVWIQHWYNSLHPMHSPTPQEQLLHNQLDSLRRHDSVAAHEWDSLRGVIDRDSIRTSNIHTQAPQTIIREIKQQYHAKDSTLISLPVTDQLLFFSSVLSEAHKDSGWKGLRSTH